MKEKEKKLEKLQSEKQEAITAQDFEKAAKIRDEEKVLKEEVDKLKSSWKGTGSSSGLVVDEDDIADILADWTHIPAARLKEEEMERLKILKIFFTQELSVRRGSKCGCKSNQAWQSRT